MLQRNQVRSQFVCRFHSAQADRNVLTYYSEESVGPSLNGFCKPREGALELNSRERDGTDLKAYEDIMEALEEGKQGPVLRQQWEIVEQCAPNNVQADVMEMECSLGGLKDFSISTNRVGDPEHDKALHEVHRVDDEEIPSIADEVEAAGGEHHN